ncbi:MAG: tRNA 2-thiouridine(34) synthase MnmA [Anaerolineaceae bacterium]|nr:tRNA 2-thiouridine(34) synthase MnmA [Anaerolineaceae bacterium]
MNEKKNIVIAMSGGVDSSVAAALLVRAGHNVTGMMLKLWSDDCEEGENACCPPEAINQARQVASMIGIPFYVIDARDEFKKFVVDSFIEGYKAGNTPNPCFICNREVRWGFFLNRILSSGADYIATGHYARVENIKGVYRLRKGIDSSKDQSYVLSGLTQEKLSHSIFPLGELIKPKVREMAREFGLPVAEKHDSQDLCFVGVQGYRGFLKRHTPESLKEGVLRDARGVVVGQHNGLANYTIGQRKGIGAGYAEPMYVISKNAETNEIVIGTESELGRGKFSIENVNWITGNAPAETIHCEVKIRYKSQYLQAEVHPTSENSADVVLADQARDITPGQIAVLYEGDFVLGSGIIRPYQTGGAQ